MSLRVLICPLVLAGCVVLPASQHHARALDPDNCGTPEAYRQCMPVIYRAPPIAPVSSTPLTPLPDIPMAFFNGTGLARPLANDDDSKPSLDDPKPFLTYQPTFRMWVLNENGTETPIASIPAPGDIPDRPEHPEPVSQEQY